MTWNPWKLRARVAELEDAEAKAIHDGDFWHKAAKAARSQIEATEAELEAIHWQRLEAARKGRESQARKRAEKAERERVVGEFTGAITSEGELS